MGSAASVKVTRRLIPFMFVLYVVAFPGRFNVGFAAPQINEDLGPGEAVCGLGAGMFFLRYSLFEVPSNPPPGRIGARARTGRILVAWGIVSMAMFLLQGPVGFRVLRFLLEVEACAERASKAFLVWRTSPRVCPAAAMWPVPSWTTSPRAYPRIVRTT